MNSTTRVLAVQILKFVDSFPGWVECEFVSAENRKHRLVDKEPIFTADVIDEVEQLSADGEGQLSNSQPVTRRKKRELARITTSSPYAIESTEGVSQFVILLAQLGPDPWSR